MQMRARPTLLVLGMILGSPPAWAQETKIRGFADIDVTASDAPGNPPAEALTAQAVSDRTWLRGS